MTSLPDLDTPFRRLAHRLPSPLRENFDTKPWEDAFATIADPTIDDRRLLAAVLWIGTKAQSLYVERVHRFPGLSSKDATVLAIALLNDQYRTLTVNARSAAVNAGLAAEGPMTLDYMSNVRFPNAHGQEMSIGDYIEAFVDSLDAWLFDAARLPEIEEDLPSDVTEIISPLIKFYSMRHILKRLFDKVLHLGHYLDDDGVWVPHDRALSTLHQAWFARAAAVFSAAPAQVVSAWSDLDPAQRRQLGMPRSVTEARPGRHGPRLKVGRLAYLGCGATIRVRTARQ
jgi:hypothetical protein